MKNTSTQDETKINGAFFLHLFVTSLSWAGIFLFSWPLMLAAYLVVLLQFQVFGRCLMNEGHQLDDGGDFTFYAYLLESLGFRLDRARVKRFVRGPIYLVQGSLVLLWQEGLGFEPLLF